MPSPANAKQLVPMLNVTDITRSVTFYTDGLGFTFRHRWIPEGKLRWCWLDLDGISVMLQEYLPNRVPEGKLGLGADFCVMCDDAVAYYRQLQENGLNPEEPFVGNGLWVTRIDDPDGYKLFFESPTDVPEETKLSELQLA